jgi:hypothetical protein
MQEHRLTALYSFSFGLVYTSDEQKPVHVHYPDSGFKLTHGNILRLE